jgi:hypothetical protein
MGVTKRTVAVVMGVAALLVFVAPAAQAHYTCGQTRPPNLDGSTPFPASIATVDLHRGSNLACGITGTMHANDQMDYYCWTTGNDGYTWTYLSAFNQFIAGWTPDAFLPNNSDGTSGSEVHCPI